MRTYFDFERDCHVVFVLTLFNIVSLYLAQTACTGSFSKSTPLTFTMMVLFLLFLGAFFIQLYNKKIDPASVHAPRWWKRPDLIKWWKRAALVQFGIVILTDIGLHDACGQHEASAGETLSQISTTMKAIETRLDNAAATLSVIPTNVEAIKTQLKQAGASLSTVPKTLEGIDEHMLNMRITQPVNLSYLIAADCRRVQQALKDLNFYQGRVDGKCDGATNAAAQAWQIRERRTIAPARTAEEIEKTLRAISE